MSDKFLFNSVYDTLKTSIDGLALRQQVISRNLANVDTPGFHAQTVSFEQALQTAQKPTTLPALQLAVTQPAHLVGVEPTPREAIGVAERQGGTERADGNNVDIDVELTQMAETGISYQAMTQLISRKYQGILAAIK